MFKKSKDHMKFTYQFMDSLIKLLKSDDWKKDLQERIVEINGILLDLPNNTKNKISQKINRWSELESSNKTTPSPEKQQEIIEGMSMIAEEERTKLIQEASDIEQCLAEGRYKLGSGIFKNIEDASLLLLHIYLLYSEDLSFNEDSVIAVESMLRENFEQIYTGHIDHSVHMPDNNLSIIKEFLLGNITSDTQPEEFIPLGNLPIEEEQLESINNYFASVLVLDEELVIHSNEKLKPFIRIFSYDNDDEWDDLILSLSSYFSSKEDIDNYLATEVDFSSFATIENSLDISDVSPIFHLSRKEREVWGKLNAKFGKKSIKLFGQANDLKNNGFDIVHSLETSDTSDPLQTLFEIIKTKISAIKFDREKENNELAILLRLYNIDENTFNKILDDILPLKKDSDKLPDVTINTSDNKFTFTKLPAGDINGLLLGKMTACCQFIGGDSEECVIDGFTRDMAGFYVLTDKNGTIKAQSYAWIGVNANREDVLVLDSFEYLPEVKKYFLELVKNLSEMIKELGYQEIYVGIGGKTPSLNQAGEYEISAKDADLYRYHDSKKLYKITQDIALSEDSKSCTKPYNSYEEFIKSHYHISFKKIKLKDEEGKLEELGEKSIAAIYFSAPILNYLLSEDDITIDQIKKLFTVDPLKLRGFNLNNQITTDHTIIWKIALKSYGDNCDYSGFMGLLSEVETTLSMIDYSILERVKENPVSLEELRYINEEFLRIVSTEYIGISVMLFTSGLSEASDNIDDYPISKSIIDNTKSFILQKIFDSRQTLSVIIDKPLDVTTMNLPTSIKQFELGGEDYTIAYTGTPGASLTFIRKCEKITSFTDNTNSVMQLTLKELESLLIVNNTDSEVSTANFLDDVSLNSNGALPLNHNEYILYHNNQSDNISILGDTTPKVTEG